MPRLLTALAATLALVCLNVQVNVTAPLLHLVDPTRIAALFLLAYCAAFWLRGAAQHVGARTKRRGRIRVRPLLDAT